MDYQQLQERVSELLKQGQYEALIEVYTEALTYGYPKRHEGEIYSALAELYGHFDDKEKSIDHYSTAITIFNELESESGEGTFFPVIAAVANNLGILYEGDNEDKAAAEKFKESLELYRKLSKSNPEAYQPYVGTTLYNLGNLYNKKPDYYNSRKHFQDAYEVFKALAEDNPINFDAYVANTLVSLGNSYVEEHDYENAELYFKKALPVYRNLANIRFDNFGPYLAATLNNLAVVSKNTKQESKSVEYYQETLELYSTMAKDNEEAFLPYKAATLNSMGILFSEMYDKDEALKYYNQAIEVYQELATKQPGHFTHYLATSIHNLAILQDEKGALKEAEDSYKKALALREQLASQYPEAFDRDVCVTAMNLVTLYQEFFEKDQSPFYRAQAETLLADVKGRIQKYDPNEPVIQSILSDHDYYIDFFQNATAEDLSVAKAFREVNELTEEIHSTIKPEEKIVFQKKILELLKERCSEYPENEQLKIELSSAYGELSWFHIRMNELQKGEELAHSGMAIVPDAYWVKMNLYYLARLKKETGEQLLKEILAGSDSQEVKEKIQEQIDKDILKLKGDGFEF